MSDCFYCSYKWNCYDRFYKSRTIPCKTIEEKLNNLKRYKKEQAKYK